MLSLPSERLHVGERILRRSLVDDAQLIADTVAASLDHLSPWMPWATPEMATVDIQKARLIQGTALWLEGNSFEYLLVDTDDTLLGIFGLHRRIGPGALELGYWLRPDAVGRGYATAAAGVLTLEALRTPGVEHVEIRCDQANVRSQAVPQRLGYRLDRVEADGVEAPAESGQGMVWIYPAEGRLTSGLGH